jgi:hypothetical protein
MTMIAIFLIICVKNEPVKMDVMIESLCNSKSIPVVSTTRPRNEWDIPIGNCHLAASYSAFEAAFFLLQKVIVS